MSKGCVYILSNPSFRREWLKIGKSDEETPFRRMGELYNTSVPLPFECLAYLVTEQYDKVERVLHKQLEKYLHKRINANREFFCVDQHRAIEMLKDVGELVNGELKLGPFKTTSQRTAAAIKIKVNHRTTRKATFFFGSTIWGAAKLAWDGQKSFTVLAGSRIRTSANAPSLGMSGVRLRKEHEKLYMPGGVLKTDVTFSSASAASDFICGTPTQGTVFWKDAQGVPIKDYMVVRQVKLG